jgi:hypothetical protein
MMKKFASCGCVTLLFVLLALSCGVLVLGLFPAGDESAPARAPLPFSPAAETSAPSPFAAPTTKAQTSTPAYPPISWKDLVSFITEDRTNWNAYRPGEYVCINFAIDLVHNARERHIPAWVVGVYFQNEDTGHAFAAFQTTDKGMVYIEPQTDIPYIHPNIGSPLCDLWTGGNCLGVIEEIVFLECDADAVCVEIPAP